MLEKGHSNERGNTPANDVLQNDEHSPDAVDARPTSNAAPPSVITGEGIAKEGEHPVPTNELEELRTLLLGSPLEKLLHPPITPEALSEMLPAAMEKAHQKRLGIIPATLPTVETVIQKSVQQDASVLAEALFPVIGPATRKSITAAIGSLVQSLNQTLEHSLSPQSFKWRLEARRTGKTFAEVVLIRTLIYQVEQVFLIHKETGLVIQHIVTDAATAQDPDLVSAMLTAIQDFVHDSFSVADEGSLDTLRLGDLTLLIEDGPQAVLACAVRGSVPVEIRELLRSQVEKIHLLFGPKLQTFAGDQSLFEDCIPYLQDCFQARFKGTKDTASTKKRAPLTRPQKILGWCLAGVLLAGLGLWSFMTWQSNRHWQQFVGTLEQQPGFVVINQYKQQGTYHLTGLHDPLASNPQALLEQSKVNANKVEMNWRPYLSLDPAFLENRTQALLNPPATVDLSLSPQGILTASGRASENWIQQAKAVSAELEGITAWQDEGLISTERENLTQLRSRIEYRRFSFPQGKAALPPRYAKTLENHTQDIAELVQTAQAINEPVHITIKGYGDQRGSETQTLQLGQTRANTLKRYLINKGIQAELLTAEGRAITSRDRPSDSAAGNGQSPPSDDDSAAYFQVRF